MVNDYNMPKLAMSMNEGTINEWLAKEGERIEKGQAILELETDKVTQEIESPVGGYFHMVAQPGETLKVNSLIAQICDTEAECQALKGVRASDTETSASETTAAAPPTSDDSSVNAIPPAADPATQTRSDSELTNDQRIIASPLAKKMARDQQLDLTGVTGTGPNGRIIKQDIVALLATAQPAIPVSETPAGSEKLRIPLKGMRKAIADRMQASLQQAAQLSTQWETDITDLLTLRQKFVAREQQLGTRISINAFILKAIAYGVQQVPIANACQQGDELVIYNSVNIGIAVSVPGSTEYDTGLLVPVLCDVHSKGLVDIDQAMKDLIQRTRSNSLSPDELQGATITMTSTAGLAPPGSQATPIINRPNAVIINPSTPKEKPVVYQGSIVPRTIMPLSLTFDHCLLDGDPAVRFAKAVHDCLENPELLLA